MTAANVGFTAPNARFASVAVTVSPFLFTVKLWSTDVAASRLPDPARLARTVTTPAPVKLNCVPLTEAGPLTTVRVGVAPESAVATSPKDASPYVLSERAPKVMTCAFFTTTWFLVRLTES